jgi:hypothetical protein
MKGISSPWAALRISPTEHRDVTAEEAATAEVEAEVTEAEAAGMTVAMAAVKWGHPAGTIRAAVGVTVMGPEAPIGDQT